MSTVKQSLQDVTLSLMEYLQNTGMAESYLVVPAAGLNSGSVTSYWDQLSKADTLKYRFSDKVEPTAGWASAYSQATPNFYFVVDVSTATIVAEFALCNFMGKAAQVHFSMSPFQDSKLSIFLAEEVTNMILNNWKDVENLEESYIDTLFGMTPVANRVACIFIRKAGFKAIGTLISGATYLGETTDALLTTKSRMI